MPEKMGSYIAKFKHSINNFQHFSKRSVRKMEKEVKVGSYIVKFKHAIRNWLNFNDVNASFNGIYISGEFDFVVWDTAASS